MLLESFALFARRNKFDPIPPAGLWLEFSVTDPRVELRTLFTGIIEKTFQLGAPVRKMYERLIAILNAINPFSLISLSCRIIGEICCKNLAKIHLETVRHLL